eukprot:TRINITY_DN892_c0_g1_i2.p1 TRINITY_DN892_c0_g1~~TRINITY_DN892_c0_g1_i2.p1  ORF type:complete len:117 (-),score=33.10 TRINITY_DN892_c0_g1_i2:59-409(-)
MLDCQIALQRITVGLKGNPPFLDLELTKPIRVKESFWMMEDGELHFQLQKTSKAEQWSAVFAGHEQAMDPVQAEEMRKQMMLERFQQENPGFDFSGAQFSGQVPDAQTFMGGVKHT